MKFILFFILYLTFSKNVTFESIHGKIFTGYQGWFSVPQDGFEKGWFHYSHPKDPKSFKPGSCSIDMV